MAKSERIYRRTQAGCEAFASSHLGLSERLRAILALIESDTHSELVRRTLRRRYGETQISEGLNELEALGFLETEAASAQHDLDFTGGFLLAELLAKQKAA